MGTEEPFRRVGIIMAGGSGERFWPLSRQNHPKQLLNLTSETKNMLQEAVERLIPLIAPEHIYVVTGGHLVKAIRGAGVGVSDENVVAEPCKRDTAGCLVFAAAHILAKYGGDGSKLSMAVVTADHQIGAPELFCKTIDASLHVAETQGALVTHGIVPTRPDTGFGYIQESSDEGEAMKVGGIRMAKAEAFHEKPNEEKAEDFIATGHYFWNSGMFFWRVDTFVEEMRLARPEMADVIEGMAKSIEDGDNDRATGLFEALEGISIDYALMEHSNNVIVVRAEYPWDDVGSWPSLDRTRERDEHGNVGIGNPVILDSENTIVYNDVGEEAMSVSVIGVRDLVVVVSKDGVLVVPKDQAMHVRDGVKALRARGSKHV